MVAVVRPHVDDVVEPCADEGTDGDRQDGPGDQARVIASAPCLPLAHQDHHRDGHHVARCRTGRWRAARHRSRMAARPGSGREAPAQGATPGAVSCVPMNDGYMWWLVLVGLGVGVGTHVAERGPAAAARLRRGERTSARRRRRSSPRPSRRAVASARRRSPSRCSTCTRTTSPRRASRRPPWALEADPRPDLG